MYISIFSTGFKPALFPHATEAPKFTGSSNDSASPWDSEQDAEFEYDSFALTTPEETFHQPPRPDMQELERKFKAFWKTLEAEHASHNHDPALCPHNEDKSAPALRRQKSFLEALKAEVQISREKKRKLSPPTISEAAIATLNKDKSKPAITPEEEPAYHAFADSRFTQKPGNRTIFNPYDTPAKKRKTEATYIPNREPYNPSRRNSFTEAVADEAREVKAKKNKYNSEAIANAALATINKNTDKQPLSPEQAHKYMDTLFQQGKKRSIFNLDL